MTTEEFWKSWLAFWIVAGGPLLLGFTGLAFSLYLTHRHLDTIKEALKTAVISTFGETASGNEV